MERQVAFLAATWGIVLAAQWHHLSKRAMTRTIAFECTLAAFMAGASGIATAALLVYRSTP